MNGPSSKSILVCEECGDRTVLDGPVSTWLSGATSFECECGERLTSAERLIDGAGGAENAAPPIPPV